MREFTYKCDNCGVVMSEAELINIEGVLSASTMDEDSRPEPILYAGSIGIDLCHGCYAKFMRHIKPVQEFLCRCTR